MVTGRTEHRPTWRASRPPGFTSPAASSSPRSIWKAPGARYAWSPTAPAAPDPVFPNGRWPSGRSGGRPGSSSSCRPSSAQNRRWTPWEYFVFTAWGGLGRTGPGSYVSDLVSRRAREPVQVTQGPSTSGALFPVATAGRSSLWAKAARGAGSLRSPRPSSSISRISAHGVAFSRDGRWVAYGTYPRRALAKPADGATVS